MDRRCAVEDGMVKGGNVDGVKCWVATDSASHDSGSLSVSPGRDMNIAA